jgi:hypothetical protein
MLVHRTHARGSICSFGAQVIDATIGVVSGDVA